MNFDVLTAFTESLGKKIKKAREERGLTQHQLAKKVGVGRTTITNIECGFQQTNIFLVMLIGEALGVSGRDLVPELPSPEVAAKISKTLMQKLSKKEKALLAKLTKSRPSRRKKKAESG